MGVFEMVSMGTSDLIDYHKTVSVSMGTSDLIDYHKTVSVSMGTSALTT